jgi:hypothetical protein
MQELQSLRISVARLAQALAIESPLITDKQGNPLPYEALVETSQQERGWNTLAALCVVASESNLNAKKAAEAEADTLRNSLKTIEDRQFHLADGGNFHDAKVLAEALELSRQAL